MRSKVGFSTTHTTLAKRKTLPQGSQTIGALRPGRFTRLRELKYGRKPDRKDQWQEAGGKNRKTAREDGGAPISRSIAASLSDVAAHCLLQTAHGIRKYRPCLSGQVSLTASLICLDVSRQSSLPFLSSLQIVFVLTTTLFGADYTASHLRHLCTKWER